MKNEIQRRNSRPSTSEAIQKVKPAIVKAKGITYGLYVFFDSIDKLLNDTTNTNE